MNTFGARRIYYNNFAEHLQNSYNPNMFYPGLPHRWSDDEWFQLVDMLAAFGFNVVEYWLVPRLFCRQGLDSAYGREFARQMNAVTEHAHRRGLKMEFICGLATIGDAWHTACPNVPAEWDEIQYLWDQWTQRLPGTDIIGLFPGDPGACSRNGCTALTYIDRCCDIASLVTRNLPQAEVELSTWGSPFFGWGNIEGPPDWKGEFIGSYQHTAWKFDRRRADDAMRHLLRRLPEYPAKTSVAINLAFNSVNVVNDAEDARPWAREIAKTNHIYSWDFGLTEGENAVFPHHRFDRLFAQRRLERESAPYSGGICYTMTPLLNQLSLFAAAHSFQKPDDDHVEVARQFFRQVFGPAGVEVVRYFQLFEVVPDWGNFAKIELSREEYHRQMTEFADLLRSLAGRLAPTIAFHPSPEAYRQELLFYAQLWADLSGPAPDYDRLRQEYWQHVYAIYDRLPKHVDDRPALATNNIIQHFQKWKGSVQPQQSEPNPGQWA